MRKVIATGMVVLGSWWWTKKHNASTSHDLYNTMKTIITPKDIKRWHNPSHTTQHNLYQTLSQPQWAENLALAEYRAHSLPTPDYATSQKDFTTLMQIRIKDYMYPGDQVNSWLEDHKINVTEENWPAVCASATMTQNRIANIRSKEMWKLFGETGKNTRNLEQKLSQNWWKSIIPTVDHNHIYQNRTPWSSLPSHYHEILSHAHDLPALSILTARYADSGKLGDATASDKNATHSMRSLGQIIQHLYCVNPPEEKKRDGLWFTPATIGAFNTLSPEDKKITLIYHLIFKRAIKSNMIADEITTKNRIKKLLNTYPKLLTVSRNTEDSDASKWTVDFQGTMVQHVYPINKIPKNYIHYLFEMLAYGQTGKTNKDGSKFLICDALTPTIQALKDYTSLSGLYNDIDTVRETLKKSSMIKHTVIVSFGKYNPKDDLYIDRNENKKIDETDKSIQQIVKEISQNLYNAQWLGQNLTFEKIKEYITRYLEMQTGDIFPVGSVIPLPDLTPENRATIDSLYPLYTEKLNALRSLSQQRYFDYLQKEHLPTLTSQSAIQKNGLVVYPICSGDDELTITRQICTWASLLSGHQSDRDLSNLTPEQYNEIYKIIGPALNLPKMEPGRQVTISLPQILHDLAPYLEEQRQFSTNLLPVPPHGVIGQFADLLPKLWIDSSTSVIIQHYILRETAGEISFWDIGKAKRSRQKYIGEKLDFDDRLSWIKKVKSQWPLQLRLNYFVEGDNHKLPWIVQASQSLINNKDLELSDSQKEDLQELIHLSKSLLNEKNKTSKDSKKILEEESQLLHILSDMINFDHHSLAHPESDLGAMLSIQLTAYQIQKYRFNYAQKLKDITNQSKLTTEQIAFIQQFCLIANHLWETKANNARNTLIAFYQTQKKTNSDYSLVSVFNEDQLSQFIDYARNLPPHRDEESAIARAIIALLWVISYPWFLTKLKSIVKK
jgi:hypothetical protein